jgi:hypothetical protein
MKDLYFFLGFVLLTSACSLSMQGFTSTPELIETSLPTPILSSNIEQENSAVCQKPPYAALSLVSAVDLSEEEITRKLVDEWLNRYTGLAVDPFCRIDNYRIDDISSDPKVNSLPLQPRGDFMRVVKFSVKLIQLPSDWMSFQGELDQENWLNIRQYVSISTVGDDYVMVFSHP